MNDDDKSIRMRSQRTEWQMEGAARDPKGLARPLTLGLGALICSGAERVSLIVLQVQVSE